LFYLKKEIQMPLPATKTVKVYTNSRTGTPDHVDVLYKRNPDGLTYSESVATDVSIPELVIPDVTLNGLNMNPELALGAKTVTLTLSTGVGSVAIPDTANRVGVKPVVSTAVRIGLEAPEASGTATGDAIAAALKKGLPVATTVWTWFNISDGTDRVLYLKGGTSDVVDVAVM
jgi:hypothetical protein